MDAAACRKMLCGKLHISPFPHSLPLYVVACSPDFRLTMHVLRLVVIFFYRYEVFH